MGSDTQYINMSVDELMNKLKLAQEEYNLLEEERLHRGKTSSPSEDEKTNAFYKLNDESVYYVSASGFRRIYNGDDVAFTNRHSSCKTQKIHEIDGTVVDIPGIQGIPMKANEPCGYDTKSIAVKNATTAEYDKIGYVTNEGKLREYISKTLDAHHLTCPTDIVEVTDEIWNTFEKDERQIGKKTPCRILTQSEDIEDRITEKLTEIEEISASIESLIDKEKIQHTSKKNKDGNSDECISNYIDDYKTTTQEYTNSYRSKSKHDMMLHELKVSKKFYYAKLVLFGVLIVVALYLFYKIIFGEPLFSFFKTKSQSTVSSVETGPDINPLDITEPIPISKNIQNTVSDMDLNSSKPSSSLNVETNVNSDDLLPNFGDRHGFEPGNNPNGTNQIEMKPNVDTSSL